MARAPEKLQSSDAWRLAEEKFLATGDPTGVLTSLTEATDAIVIEAYRVSVEPAFARSAALLAAGAYGRRETFPYSGADIIVLLEQNSESEAVKSVLAAFAQLLWGAGLRLNYSVRTVAQCLDLREQNPDLTASLLDRRFLAGDGALHARLEGTLPAVIAKHASAIGQRLSQQARTRHANYQNTCHYLEPDVKEGPGGLRDVRLIAWLAHLYPAHQPPGSGLEEAARLVASVRCFLHYHAGRDSNVLDFSAQAALASQAFTSGRKPIEWMREYFRNSRMIWNEARRTLDASERSPSSLLDNFREFRTRLSNSEFTVSRERLFLRNPAQLDADPELILRMMEFVARHGVPPAPETERRLEAVCAVFAGYCVRPQPLWLALRSILSCPQPGIALRALENAGLLPALFPEWADIEDLPVRDPEHRYTADEHSLAAVECIAGLRSETDAARHRFAEVLSEIDQPALLLFAVLFHDMGTAADGSARPAVERARAAMGRIQMPAQDRITVEFLIAHQNDLADVITGRDLGDPATVRAMAERVGTVERLKLLSIMTYAGIRLTNSDAMTSWRLEQLWRAHSSTRRELTRELETDRIEQVPEDLSNRANFLKGFPMRYMRTHSREEIETHVQQYELSQPTGVAVQIDQVEGAYRLTVVARDRPYLFASFAAGISSFGLNILKAEAFSNATGIILDTFVFADPKRMLQLNPSEVERLRDLITRVALGKTDAQRLMRSRPLPEPKKHITPPQVRFDSETCENATLIEIETEDRTGLLYSLATVLSSHACNIDVVLIDTKGNQAIDVFYVAYDGHKLSSEMEAKLKEKLIEAC